MGLFRMASGMVMCEIQIGRIGRASPHGLSHVLALHCILLRLLVSTEYLQLILVVSTVSGTTPLEPRYDPRVFCRRRPTGTERPRMMRSPSKKGHTGHPALRQWPPPKTDVAHGRAIRCDATQNPLYRADQIMTKPHPRDGRDKVQDFSRWPKPRRV